MNSADFVRQWAHAHDLKCELRILVNPACNCYARWLEARLEEIVKNMPEAEYFLRVYARANQTLAGL